MQDLRSCFFTNEVVVRNNEGEKVELKGNVHFMNSKIDNLTICHLVVVNEEGYGVNALGRDSIYHPDSLESQRLAFYDALITVVDSMEDLTVSFIPRNNVNVEGEI